jgi:hypothetical protein
MSKKQIIAGRKARQAGLDFEDLVMTKRGGFKPDNRQDIFAERITMCKTDIKVGENNYSIKNPKNSHSVLQIQTCSVERFCRLFKVPKKVKLAFDQFFGNHPDFYKGKKYKNVFESVCKQEWKKDLKTLDAGNEIRRNRLLFQNIDNGPLMLDWIEKNMKKIAVFVFKTSFNNPKYKDSIANKMLWSQLKNDYDSLVEVDIDDMIKDMCLNPVVKVRDNSRYGQSVIEIGPITLQMKGSGKTGSAYHGMQFNASYKDLKKHIK